MGRVDVFLRTPAGLGMAFALIVVVKLWLVSEIRILPLNAPHDASNFLEHAKSILLGQWFGPYDQLTLIKGPVFPLYLAAVQELGVPLPLAHQLLYAFASLVAVTAAAPLIRNGYARITLFAVLLFNPFTYATLAWVTYRSQLTESLALIALACAFAIFVRRAAPVAALLPWFIGLSVSFAAFWLTREEGIWLVPALLLLLAAYAWSARHGSRLEGFARLSPLALPPLTLLAAIASIAIINGRAYGWYTTVEPQAPEFVSAYNALARIDVPSVYRVPVPRAARALAYRVSPAAAELKPSLDGPNGNKWARVSCESWNVCGDIGGGWFMWAFRDAVAAAGHYSSGAAARTFYRDLAAQLDAACNAHAIACRPKRGTLVPPLSVSDAKGLAAEFLTGLRQTATWHEWSLNHWALPSFNPSLENDYTFVARDIDHSASTTAFQGWLLRPSVRAIEVGGDPEAYITFKPAPDVRTAFANQAAYRGADFALPRFIIWTTCSADCALVVTDTHNKQTRIPLSPSVHDFRGAGLIYHLEAVSEPSTEHDFDDGRKVRNLDRVAGVYRIVSPYAVTLSLVLLLFRLRRAQARRSLRTAVHAVLAGATLVSVMLLLLILAVIDYSSFPGFTSEYVGSLYPPALFACMTVFLREYITMYRLFRARSASRVRIVGFAAASAVAMFVGGTFLAVTPTASSAEPTVASVQPAHSFSCARRVRTAANVARGVLDDVRIANRTASPGESLLVARPEIISLRGWGADAAARLPLAGVCLTVDGKIVGNANVVYGSARPDVAAAFTQPALSATGYEISVSSVELPTGRHFISVVGVTADGRDERIGGPRVITVR